MCVYIHPHTCRNHKPQVFVSVPKNISPCLVNPLFRAISRRFSVETESLPAKWAAITKATKPHLQDDITNFTYMLADPKWKGSTVISELKWFHLNSRTMKTFAIKINLCHTMMRNGLVFVEVVNISITNTYIGPFCTTGKTGR